MIKKQVIHVTFIKEGQTSDRNKKSHTKQNTYKK